MYCKQCGAENPDNASRCMKCGGVMQPAGGPPGPAPVQNVPNYLVQSILVTLFCCLPFGIVSIIFATQVDSKLRLGDYAGAVESSNKAKTWSWAAFGAGLVAGLIYLVIGILGAMAGAGGAGGGMRPGF